MTTTTRALHSVETAANQYRKARQTFYEAIAKAAAVDCTIIAIGRAAGVSRARVYQILQAQEKLEEEKITGDQENS